MKRRRLLGFATFPMAGALLAAAPAATPSVRTASWRPTQPLPDARPNCAAPIYGAPISAVPPIPAQGLPPFFMAMAQDDNLAGPMIVALYDAIKKAGYKPEFHIFSSGGHGWGMRKQGKTSDHWIDEFYWWLEAQGLTRQAK